MKKLFALILIVAGVIVASMAYRRSESVVGVADSAGAKVANTWDGSLRQPDHVWYYVASGALILIGGVLFTRRG